MMSIWLMRTSKCRRLPVVREDRKLLGIVSLDDIMGLLTGELDEISELLRSESPMRLF